MKISFSNRYVRDLLVFLVLAVAAAFSYFRVFELFELRTYDWRYEIRGQRPVSDKIVIIEVDNETIQALGDWPFNRAAYGKLIGVLRRAPVLAIVFDFMISLPRDGDEPYIKEAALAGNTYFGMSYSEPRKERGRFVSDKIDTDLIAAYRRVAKGVGFVNTPVDSDGKRRRIWPVIYYGGAPQLQLSFRVAADLLGIQSRDIRYVPGKYMRFSPDARIPLDEDGYFIVNYACQWAQKGGFKHYRFLDIYEKALSGTTASSGKPGFDLNELKGKICIVGMTATSSHDLSPIPFQSKYRMVGLYANVLNGILQKDFIRRLDRFSNLVVVALCAFLMGVVSVRLRPARATAAAAGILLTYIAVATAAFVWWGLWIDLFYPVMILASVFAAATLARMTAETRKRQLAEAELTIAGRIQRSFLPESPPVVKGLSISCFMQAAKGVGGDMYAFVPLEGERLGIMVGDVSGKGTPAALFMAKVVSEFKFAAHEKLNPAEVLRKLNDRLVMESRSGLLVTVSYVIFDPNNRKLIMASGGHLPMVALTKEGGVSLLNVREGLPIGVMAGTPFTTHERELKDGECFIFYSDGVSEARNLKGEEFGIKALQEVVAANQKSLTKDILDSAVRALARYIGKAEQHDDITLIVVKTSF